MNAQVHYISNPYPEASRVAFQGWHPQVPAALLESFRARISACPKHRRGGAHDVSPHFGGLVLPLDMAVDTGDDIVRAIKEVETRGEIDFFALDMAA